MLKYILISFLFITNVYAYTCEEMGYTKSIADCYCVGLRCPSDPKKVFCCDPCGDGRGYRYNEENCSPDAGLQLAGVECGGRWTECRNCTSEYKYNKDNCNSPKILSGLQCGNAYTECVDYCGSEYKYDENNCLLYNHQLSGRECGGKWTDCNQCGSEYKYAEDNCISPKVLGGLQCGKMYTECNDVCGSEYKYDESNCSLYNQQLSGVECGGKWSKCDQCAEEYKYTEENCQSPNVLGGMQCARAYTECINPEGNSCEPTVGYIYYSDGSCGEAYDDSKEAIGVIVDATRKTMIALDEQTKITWNDGTSTYKDVTDLPNITSKADALLDFDGQGNTDKIVAFAVSSGQEQKAAQYCANKIDGNRRWYLPALGELNDMYSKKDVIQTSLASISTATQLTLSNYHWSSTENLSAGAWFLRPSDGLTGGNLKYYTSTARCFSAF